MFAFLVPLLAGAGSIAAGVGSAAIGAGGAALGAVGSVGGAALSTAGAIGSGAWTLGGQVIGMAGQAPAAAWGLGGQAVSGVGKMLASTGEFVTQDLPGIVKQMQPVIDVVGQGYTMYQSYEQQRAAAKAAEKYGGQVAVPYPVGVVGGPSPSGGFQTIVDVAMPGQGAQLAAKSGMSPEDVKKVVTVAAIGTVAYMVLK